MISQISQVLLRRETTRDRSYQGPSISSRLLRRTLPTKALGTQRTGSYQGFVRFASITHTNTQYDLFTECQYPQHSSTQYPTTRDNTRSLLPRPVDRVAFAKENPSGIGSGNSKNWLLPRLRPVRVHHANQYPICYVKNHVNSAPLDACGPNPTDKIPCRFAYGI